MTPALATAPTWWLAAGCTMLHVLWVGGLIGLFAFAGRRLLRLAPLRLSYLFTLVCLLALLTAPAVLFVRVVHRMQDRQVGAIPLLEQPADADEDLALLAEGAVWVSRARNAASPSPIPAEAPPDWLGAAAPCVTELSAVLPWVWVAGAATGLGLVAGGIYTARRLKRQALMLRDEPPAALCDRLARRFGLGKVEVAVSDHATSPMLIGIRRPTVLLPAVAAQTWRPDQLEMVLLHELWHVRRRDNLVNLVQCLIESLMFFHPAVWRISHWLRLDRENCCDSAVLQETRKPLAYAQLLAALAVGQQGRGRLVLAMGEHNLVGRIRHVLGGEPRSSHRLAAVAIWVFLAVASSAAAAIFYSRSDWIVVPVVATPAEEPPEAAGPPTPSIESEGALAAPPTQTASPRQQDPSISDRITLRIVDAAGHPVAGARAGIRIKWSDQDADWPVASAPFVSDSDGVVSIASKKLVEPVGPGGCDPLAPCYVFHEGRGLAGALSLSLEDWGRTCQVVLQPVSRLRFKLTGPDPAGESGPVAWTKGFVRLPGNRLSYLLRKTQPELSTFEYLLPPGQYELVATAGTGAARATGVVVGFFTVPAGTGEVDLGIIKLEPAPERSRPDGAAPAPEKREPASRAGAGFGWSVSPSSETRGPWWENSNP